MKQIGTTMTVRRSAALNVTPGMLKLASNGGSRRGEIVRSPNRSGRKSAAPVSTWATPIVATVTIRRGDL